MKKISIIAVLLFLVVNAFGDSLISGGGSVSYTPAAVAITGGTITGTNLAGSSYVGTLGANLVTNGTFATDLSGWQFGIVAWTWSAGTAVTTPNIYGSYIRHLGAAAVIGTIYKVQFDIVTLSAGSLQYTFGGYTSQPLTTTGTHTEYIQATTTAGLSFNPTTTFGGSIDNVSIQALGSPFTITNVPLIVPVISTNQIIAADYSTQNGPGLALGNPWTGVASRGPSEWALDFWCNGNNSWTMAPGIFETSNSAFQITTTASYTKIRTTAGEFFLDIDGVTTGITNSVSMANPGARLAIGTNGNILQYPSATNAGGGISRSFVNATATLSGASTVITLNIPADARLALAQLRVDTAVTSDIGTSWSAAYSGGSTTAICAAQAFTKNTKANKMNAGELTTTTTNITILPTAGTFTGGVIRAVVYYDYWAAMGDN